MLTGLLHVQALLSAALLVYALGNEVNSQPTCPAACSCFTDPNADAALTVNCSSLGLVSVPEFFPSDVAVLLLGNNNIQLLQDFTFQKVLTKLQKIYLQHNQITMVGDKAISLPYANLKQLDLSYNQLTEMPSALPQTIEILHLGNNKISSFDLSQVAALPNLHHLWVDHNLLQNLTFGNEVSRKSLTSYRSRIKRLALNNNNISEIQSGLFLQFASLEGLTLANNTLTSINVSSFAGLSNLVFLDLSHNLLQFITPGTFKFSNSLKYLYLNNNKIKDIPSQLPMVEWLDLSYNFIRNVSESKETDLYPIDVLNLAGNPLHCDCNLLWLKELYDRREHLLHHVDDQYRRLVPTCASPTNLAGEYWDELGDQMFICTDKGDSEQRYSPMKDVHGENTISVNRLRIRLLVQVVGDHSVTLQWKVDDSDPTDMLKLQYYPFGQRHKITSVIVSAAWRQYTLQGLAPSTNYFICVLPDQGQPTTNSVRKVNVDHCVEVTTAPEAFYIFIYSKLIDCIHLASDSLMNCLWVIVALTIVAGFIWAYANGLHLPNIGQKSPLQKCD